VTAPITFPPMTGRRFRVTIEAVRPVTTPDFFSPQQLTLPVAIAELGLPGVQVDPLPTTFETPCRDDLVTLDDRPLPVRVGGTTADADARAGLTVRPCGGAAALDLAAGDHELRTAHGTETGLDVDRIVLSSAAPAAATGPSSDRPPTLQVRTAGRTGFDVRTSAPSRPFWLVLGQSHNLGWHLTIDGEDAGPPQLVDGYANGWRIDAPGAPLDLRLRWTPQRTVDIALVLSAVTALACLLVVVGSLVLEPRRRRRRPAHLVVADLRGTAATGATDDPGLVAPGDRRPHVVAPLLVAVAFGLAADPLLGVAAGVLTALAVVVRPARWALAFGAALALAAAGAYTALMQLRYRYPPDFAWPVNVERAHLLGWLAVALATATVGLRQDRRIGSTSEESLKRATDPQHNRNESG
jgi:hypothetical protein